MDIKLEIGRDPQEGSRTHVRSTLNVRASRLYFKGTLLARTFYGFGDICKRKNNEYDQSIRTHRPN